MGIVSESGWQYPLSQGVCSHCRSRWMGAAYFPRVWWCLSNRLVVHLLSFEGEHIGFVGYRNVTVSGYPNKFDTEAIRKKVMTVVTFPDDLRVIRYFRQRFYGNLAIRKDRDTGERNIVCGDPLIQPFRWPIILPPITSCNSPAVQCNV